MHHTDSFGPKYYSFQLIQSVPVKKNTTLQQCNANLTSYPVIISAKSLKNCY